MCCCLFIVCTKIESPQALNNSYDVAAYVWPSCHHDVKRNYWNVHKYRDDTSQLWKGAVDLENFKIIVSRVIAQYFSQPNYYKINGKPVFSTFHLRNLMDGLGGQTQTREALDYFRKETVKAGFPGLHLQLIVFTAPSKALIESIEDF